MTEEEFIPNRSREEEEEEESGPTTLTFSTSSVPPKIDPEQQEFMTMLSNFKMFVPDIHIQEHLNDKIEFSIPSSLIPVTLRVAFGFLDSEQLLDVIIELENYNWRKKPTICIIKNSTNNDYCGKSLVEDAKTRFFTNEYKPKKSYRCAPLFIRAEKDYDAEVVSQIIKSGFSRMQAIRAASLCDNDYDESINFLQTGQYQLKGSFQLPLSYYECPLLYFILEIVDAIFDLQDHCCMCGKPTTPGLKANICEEDICAYRYIDIGVGLTLTKEIGRDPFVADLLFSVFACTYSTDYFNPKPRLNDRQRLKEIIDKMPKMKSLGDMYDDAQLTQCVGAEARDILRWVILACRSNFLLLPPELEFPQFRSRNAKQKCYQFMALTASPERENIFQQLKKKYGSFFLWHGSSTDRWHAIIRTGLKNLSNTKWMRVGAACGEGIYFAPNSGTSLGYSQSLPNLYPKSALGKDLQIIALCEVIKLPFNQEVTFVAEINAEDPETKSTKTIHGHLNDHRWCYTLTMNEACVTRFVFANFDNNIDVNVVNNPPKKIPSLIQVLKKRANI